MGVGQILVMLGMIAFNSVFAAYEIALAALSLARVHILAQEDRPGAKAALYMKQNVEGSLAAVQIGITLFGVIAAATGGAGAEESIAPLLRDRFGWSTQLAEFIALTLVVLPLTAFTILFGELVPKVFALRNPERVCLKLSPAMRCFTFSVWPAVWFFESIVSALANWGQKRLEQKDGKSESAELQELRASVALARMSRLIGQREEGIIIEAARLTRRPIREIMMPGEVISMLDVNATLTENLIAAHLEMHTRFPVTEERGNPQRIVGYVNVKDMVAILHHSPHDASLRAILRPLPSFQEDETISTCLERLLRENLHIALVRDQAGVILGMVTLEDIVEELLGDIKDEYDRLPTHIRPTGAGWIVGGGVTLDKLMEQAGLDLASISPSKKGETLNDWLTAHLARGVQPGETFTHQGIRIAVRKSRRQRLVEGLLSRSG